MTVRCALTAATAALALAACSGSPGPAPRTLVGGAPVEASLKAGEVHRYRVALRADGGAELVAVQRSIDVTLALLDAGGAEIAREGQRGSGEEVLLVRVPRDGDYELRVLGEASRPPGQYVISLQEIPSGDPRLPALERHAAARRQTEDGAARRQLAAAREAWEAAGDQRMAAHAWMEAGVRSRALREPAAAVRAFEEAARTYQALGLAADRALAGNLLGEAIGDEGDYRRACARWKATIAMEAALTPGDRASLRFNYASALQETGEYAAAAPGIRRAVLEFHELEMKDEEMVARTALADAFLSRRDLPAALAELNEGAALSRQYALPSQEARFQQRLGILYSEAGDAEAAAEYWERALTLHRSVGNRTGEAAVLMQLGDLAATVRDSAGAERSYRQALEIFRAIGQKQGEARALRRLGNLLSDHGDYQEAVELHERALRVIHEMGNVQGEVLTMAGLARAKAGTGDRAGAARLLKSALTLTRGHGAGIHEPQILGELALLARDRGARKEALKLLDEALGLLEAEQRAALVPSLQATLSGDSQTWYAARTDLLLRLGQPERALECSERARARALLALLAESRVDLRQGVDEGLLDRYRALEVKLSEADRAHSAEVPALTAKLHALETEIRRASPAYAALTQPIPLSVEEIRTQVLDDRTLLLEFALGKNGSWVFALGKDGLVSAPLPPAERIEAAAGALYGKLAGRQAGEAEAAALSGLLLRPLAARLDGAWRGLRLAIVPDGALQYVPFAALPVGTPARALIEEHEIVVLPSASVLHAMRREVQGRASGPLTVALLGDPVFDAADPRVQRGPEPAAAAAVLPDGSRGFPRLPFSRDEVKAIAALLPPAQVLQATDFAATRALAMDGTLSRYRALHIATHGLLNTVRPELSGVVLSLVDAQGRPQDGFLRLQDIYNLRLSADLVVLSACQTALGRAIAGEGLVGLTRGFMHAGAPRVVASLWRVDDSATAELMRDFYRGMIEDKATAAQALRAAQRKLARDRRFSSPFFWAGFTLQGDWR